jgi:hypothetical protein
VVVSSGGSLLELLERARSGLDPELERQLLDAIAESQLVVPVRRDPSSGETGLEVPVNPDGSRHLLGFTSVEELSRWAQGEVEHGTMSGRDLAAAARTADAVALWIDPASSHGGRLERDRVDLVAAHGALSLQDEEHGVMELRTGRESLMVGPLDASELGASALSRLREALSAQEGLSEAWLVAGAGPGAADVVLVTVGSEPEPSPEVLRVLAQTLPAGRSGDVYPVREEEFATGAFDAVRRGVQVLGR